MAKITATLITTENYAELCTQLPALAPDIGNQLIDIYWLVTLTDGVVIKDWKLLPQKWMANLDLSSMVWSEIGKMA